MGLERRRLGLAAAVLDHRAVCGATGRASARAPTGAGSTRSAARRLAAALAESVAARAVALVAASRDYWPSIETTGL